MKKELIVKLFEQLEEACYLYDRIECWSARDLQVILGYTKRNDFVKVIEKVQIACEGSGIVVSDYFADVRKMGIN